MSVDRLVLPITVEELATDSSLLDDHGVDSVSLLELVVGLEDEFGLQIEDGDFDVRNFESVEALAKFVAERVE